jgi:hypothetical protein
VIFTVFIASTLVGCDLESTSEVPFYPVDSLMNAQVRGLSVLQASLAKNAVLGPHQSTVTYVPQDTVAWKRELEIFYYINNINKPVNRTLYSVKEYFNHDLQLNVKSFKATDETPVEFLIIYYRETPVMPEKIEARIRENNSMYSGTRDLQMKFEKAGSNVLLTEFFIAGGQKMLLGDSVQYRITGKISLSGN